MLDKPSAWHRSSPFVSLSRNRLDNARLQELLHIDLAAAEEALRQFQSCVRTTLLLCHGYECQEKVSSSSFTAVLIAGVD